MGLIMLVTEDLLAVAGMGCVGDVGGGACLMWGGAVEAHTWSVTCPRQPLPFIDVALYPFSVLNLC